MDKKAIRFNVGDRVRLIGDIGVGSVKVGDFGTIVKVNSIDYRILFDTDLTHAWYASDKKLEPAVNDIKAKTKKKKDRKSYENRKTIKHIINGRQTIVVANNANGTYKKGIAVCHEDDKFNEYEGLRVALARAYGVDPFPNVVSDNTPINSEIDFDSLLQDFKNRKFVIHCDTKSKAKELLAFLETKGFIWSNSVQLTDSDSYDTHKSTTCYWSDNKSRITYSDVIYAISLDLTVITFDDFFKGITTLKTPLFDYSTQELLDELARRIK